MKVKNKDGRMGPLIRAVSLPRGLDELIENVRRRLGLTRSRFYMIALTEYLRSLSVLSDRVKDVGG